MSRASAGIPNVLFGESNLRTTNGAAAPMNAGIISSRAENHGLSGRCGHPCATVELLHHCPNARVPGKNRLRASLTGGRCYLVESVCRLRPVEYIPRSYSMWQLTGTPLPWVVNVGGHEARQTAGHPLAGHGCSSPCHGPPAYIHAIVFKTTIYCTNSYNNCTSPYNSMMAYCAPGRGFEQGGGMC